MRIAVVCADRGIRVDGTKGASVHLRSIAAALSERHEVWLVTAHAPAAATSRAWRWSLDDLDAVVSGWPADAVYERYSLGHTAGITAARRAGKPFVLEVNAPLFDEAS